MLTSTWSSDWDYFDVCGERNYRRADADGFVHIARGLELLLRFFRREQGASLGECHAVRWHTAATGD